MPWFGTTKHLANTCFVVAQPLSAMQSNYSFPMWAARAAAEQAERTARQRLNKMIQNNNDDDDERSEQNAIRFDELLRRVFVDNLLPLIIWFVEVILCLTILAILSVVSYMALYRWVIMRGLEVQTRPIFFDYNPPGIRQGQSSHTLPPIGRVDLHSSKRAPWAYSCSFTDDSFCVIDDDRIIHQNHDVDSDDSNCHICDGPKEICTTVNNEASKKECQKDQDCNQPILLPNQRYFFEVTLTLPESEINKQLGMFMVTVDLRSSDKQLLASSKQSSMLPFESNMIAIFRKLSLLFPLSAGLLAETRTITLLSFDNYVDVSDKRSLSYVEVTLGVPNPASFSSSLQSIQVQSSKLRYGKEMSPIQEFFRSMRWPCAFLGTTFFFIIYLYTALSMWRRRTGTIRWDAQPYADFFSDDGSAPNNSMTGSARWMNADIEILEEEFNDSDNWEPLSETKKNGADGHSAKRREPADQIVSDEEESVSSADPNAETEKGSTGTGTTKVNDTGKSSFPFGKIASNDALKGRSYLLGQKPSREDEEKSLADMVMKGYSKYEIFTDQDDADR
ncbi:hypothetical protein ACHAXM_005405 [Skeletonema potamos]